MKVVILAGGFGTRLSGYTERIPKPMVPIGKEPIIKHIMQRYAHFGYKDFYIALGYKAQVIRQYFESIGIINPIKSKLNATQVILDDNNKLNWKVTLVDTGENSMTGGRVKQLKEFIDQEPFQHHTNENVTGANFLLNLGENLPPRVGLWGAIWNFWGEIASPPFFFFFRCAIPRIALK